MAKGGIKPGSERWILASAEGPVRYKTGTIMMFISKQKAFSYAERNGKAGVRYHAFDSGYGNF